METTILYILVSSENDVYLEQARISIASVRHHNKNAKIVLMVDPFTYNSLEGNRALIKDEVNEIKVIDVPENLSPHLRSRILKTTARQYIKGDFLFIDTDTVILSSLAEVDNWKFDLGACYDSHSLFQSNPYKKMCETHCKLLGLDISKEDIYFNSGVLFVKDSPITHKFYEEWYETWKKGVERGVKMDQPSFEVTNIRNNYLVTQIPDIWNCQIIHGIKYLPKAKILHYLCTNSFRTGDIFPLRGMEEFKKIKDSGEIPDSIKILFDDPFEGIPSLTHLQGDKSIYILRTSSWYLLTRLYSTRFFKYFEGAAKNIASFLSWLRHH